MEKSTRKGNIIVLTGPSGVGKGTIVSELVKKHSDIVLSVSATTRLPRPAEIEGVHYYYVSRDEFLSRVSDGKMLEWAEFAGNLYGTFLDSVIQETEKGNDIILEIEVKGAMQVKSKLPQAILVFISPPDVSELLKRLSGRGTEPADVIQKRISIAQEELALVDKFDYNVVNDDITQAIKDVETVILSKRLV